jgi:hypothetical protein
MRSQDQQIQFNIFFSSKAIRTSSSSSSSSSSYHFSPRTVIGIIFLL